MSGILLSIVIEREAIYAFQRGDLNSHCGASVLEDRRGSGASGRSRDGMVRLGYHSCEDCVRQFGN